MKEIKAVVFDMDGLMFDTEKLWLESVIKTNEEYGYNVPFDTAVECVGKRKDYTKSKLKEVLGENFDADKFRELNVMFMNEDVNKNGLRVKKGLTELLEFLYEKNIKIAIASSSSNKEIEKRLKEANISLKYFDSIIGGYLVSKPKPDPEIYLKSCEILNVNPKNALALEDSEYGVISASKAGMKVILIPDIKLPSKEIQNLAYKTLNNLLEVIDLFN
ncbi:MAG: HAD family phosphatase [Tenericutes bacterium]|nr:HAD family phosphatase [Mycoplasmatota bacterium]